MKIHEILIESHQLDEGPILNKIGSAVGKGVGALAKGVGAVAGGVAGLGSAVKKGFQAGKATVGGAGDGEEPAADPATTDKRNILQKVRDTMPGSKPTTGTAVGGTTQATQEPPAADTDGGTAQVPQQPPAQKKPTSAFGKLSAAAAGQPTDDVPAADPKADTAYAQAQKAIAGLQPEQKKEIVTMLQADPKVKAAMTAKPTTPDPAAQARIDAAPQGYDGETGKPNAAPEPGKTEPAAEPGAGAMGNMAGQLAKGGAAEPNTMANAPVSKTNTAKPGNPNAEPVAAEPTAEPQSGGKLTAQQQAAKKAEILGRRGAGQTAGTTQSGFGNYVKKASGQRIVGANKDGSVRTVNIKASKINTGNNLSETLAEKIEAERKRIMGPTSDSIIKTKPRLAEGFSLFRKR